MPLFKKEENIIPGYLKKELNKILDENIISAVLYGSFASGAAKLNSDIDVMVIVKKDNGLTKELDKLKDEFLKNDLLLRVDVITLSEFKKLYKQREPLIDSIMKNHKMILGKDITKII